MSWFCCICQVVAIVLAQRRGGNVFRCCCHADVTRPTSHDREPFDCVQMRIWQLDTLLFNLWASCLFPLSSLCPFSSLHIIVRIAAFHQTPYKEFHLAPNFPTSVIKIDNVGTNCASIGSKQAKYIY
ncbi:hypothetical protein IF1G_00075 [Cordyceps javanica]|uniref:Secreted protein n=1 Tax=Cordyceps javanica TaxID=43265 RepID=A0A545VEJ0_9HYPO|nr:hypothetical protein IF1G_00075 [Cordyceps javanica]TQW11343.1 hypothetical protein IF2G_00074 [Cordyceps javanica]